MFKKFLSVLLATSLLLSLALFSSNVTTIALDDGNTVTSEDEAPNKFTGSESDLDFIYPVTENNVVTYYDSDNNVVDITPNNAPSTVDESTLPDSFDLRDEGRLTSVKNQGTEGFCWNFATTSSMESSILSNPELRAALGEYPHENLDLSEVGNSWFIHTNVQDENSFFYGDYIDDENKGAHGGNYEIVAQGLSSGFGSYPEDLMPYESWGYPYSESLRFYSDYRLKDMVVLPAYEIALLKDRIMEYGSIYVSYHNFRSNYYYNDEMMQSYFDTAEPLNPSEEFTTNHAVSIVGWDDNYSRENFNPLMQPENDGAWLCKNSWGENSASQAEGYEGFFWMSYESFVFGLAQYEMQSAEDLENIYQHQYTCDSAVGIYRAANVFTAVSDEVVEQICYTGYDENNITIEIYRLNENYSDPEDGVLLSSFDADIDFTGTHTIEVPDRVEISAGDMFSVVIKSDEKVYIGYRTSDKSEANKSFFESDGQWIDAVEDTYVGYLAIKAYTSNKNGVVYKDKLQSAINNAEAYKATEKISPSLLSKFNDALFAAQEVLNDASATQNKVNNTICLLNDAIDNCKYSEFEINSIDDFLAFVNYSNNGMYYDAEITLNTDLDFSGIASVMPLFAGTTFSGVFNGNGHTLSNMNINYYNGGGLFCNINGAVVKNVNLKNCTINSGMNTGTIAGKAFDSVISGCTVTGADVTNDQDYAGGVVGYAEFSVISDCFVTDTKIISRNNLAGGIVGDIYSVEFNNCSVSNSDITGYTGAVLFAGEDFNNCVYDKVVLKSFERLSVDEQMNVYKNASDSDCYSFLVFEDGKFTIQPYIGVISDVSADGAIITKVGEFYEIELTDTEFGAYIEVEYEPLNTNGFTFSFDISKDTVMLTGYYNYTDETKTEVVFPSYIGTLDVTDISFLFKMESVAPIKSVVLPENITSIIENMFSTCPDLEKITIPANITTVGSNVFSECYGLTDVYYGGTQEQWDKIHFGKGNENLLNANIHFASTPDTEPTEPESTATEPVESTPIVTEPESTVTEPVESTPVVTEPESTVTEPVESTPVVTEPESTVTEPVESTPVVTEPESTVTEPAESSTATEATETTTETASDTEPTQETTTVPQPEYETGDVNKDGKTNIKDATLIQKYLAKLLSLDDDQILLADVNRDNKVNIKDATYIQKKIAHLI